MFKVDDGTTVQENGLRDTMVAAGENVNEKCAQLFKRLGLKSIEDIQSRCQTRQQSVDGMLGSTGDWDSDTSV